MKRNHKPSTAKGRNALPARQSSGKVARIPAVLALAWAAAVIVSALLTGCPAFNALYAAYLLVTLALVGGELAFLSAIYRDGRTTLFPAFKKFMGYGLVAQYVAAALPRVGWSNLGIIGSGRVAVLFLLSIVCLVFGLAFFFVASRPSIHAALGLITQQELEDRALLRKHRSERKKGAIGVILEWVDALAFAAIAVILVNIFIFQLYVVPSESMVPVFLSGDRPFTSKFLAGPRIPLTDWRLPFLRAPQRGDVVTIANPRYPENHRVDLKKYLSQLVAMVTFTAVNIDTLPDGTPKADPLVKRVVGLPGEKLMMVDDVLYVKRKGDSGFAPLAADRAFARIDLWKEPDSVRARIATIRVDEAARKVLGAIDERKRNADPLALASDVSALAARIRQDIERSGPAITQFEQHELPRLNQLVISSNWFETVLNPDVISPIKKLRSWAFVFCFLCIGLSTRFAELLTFGMKPFWAFTVGVLINVPLGVILSTMVFVDYWMKIG